MPLYNLYTSSISTVLSESTLKGAKKHPLLLLIFLTEDAKLCIVRFRNHILYNIIRIMLFFISQNKPQAFYLPLMLTSRGNNINTRCIDTGVA